MSQDEEAVDELSEMIIECNDTLDVSVVFDFKSILQQAVGHDMPVILDASKIQRIDAAALQLLASFFNELIETGQSISWRKPTEELKYAAELTGMKSALHL